MTDNVENCGLRKIGMRRSTTDPAMWEIYVSAHNYGAVPRAVTVSVGIRPSAARGAVPVGTQQMTLPAGGDREADFQFRTRPRGCSACI